MGSQSNIYSFDEMKRVARPSRSGELSPSAANRAQQTGRYIPSREDVYGDEDYDFPEAPESAFSHAPRSNEKPAASQLRREQASRRAREAVSSWDYSSQSTAYRPAPADESFDWDDWDDLDQADDFDEEEEEEASRGSRREERKRARAKSKAERAYKKRYGKQEAAAAEASAAEGAPRAAVYKGEMGRTQRKSMRMQDPAASEPSARRARATAKSPHSRLAISLTVAACLVFSCAFLYPTARQYYQQMRENDQLEAEYAALLERNETIEDEIAVLETDSGVEQAAREELGWVMDGETSAVVEGLDDEDADEEDDSSVQANIVSGSVEMPETWYSPVLDLVFGVE